MSVNGTNITIEGVASGTAIITVSVGAGTNHTAPTNETITIKVLAPAGEYVLNTLKPSGLNTAMEAGLYRFQGTSANNYICFGTSDKSTCTGNTDAYMYRIMGINSSGQLKLIKKEALNTAYRWYSSSSNITWPNSDLYKGLNGSYFLNNTTYVPSGWSDKIANVSWKYGDNFTWDLSASNLYSTENGWSSKITAKIGLWYMHDYYYGTKGGKDCSLNSSTYPTCQSSWIFLWNSGNDTSAPNTIEWTMSRYGAAYVSYLEYHIWYVTQGGYVGTTILTSTASIRPVFFLVSDVSYISGTGTLSDPILIN